MFSYPMHSDGNQWKIVQNLTLSEFARSRITRTENELKEEKSLVADLLPKA